MGWWMRRVGGCIHCIFSIRVSIRLMRYRKTRKQVYFAYCYPYSYAQGTARLRELVPVNCIHSLGSSIAKNNLQAVVLGTKGKPLLLIMARVHPCETVSSFMMEGVIQALSLNTQDGAFLLEHCRIILVPMLNPDGVIHGNSRSSYAGCDLNRRWLSPTAELHPQLCSLKQRISSQLKQCKPFLCIDLHGHSGKQNLFFYGCPQQQSHNPTPNLNPNPLHHHHHYHPNPRLLPTILRNLSPTTFSPSTYHIHPSRLSTARVTLSKPFQSMSYTLEASMMGSSRDLKHFTRNDYVGFGRLLVRGIRVLRAFDLGSLGSQIYGFSKKMIMGELKREGKQEVNSDDSSDSQKSLYNLPNKPSSTTSCQSSVQNTPPPSAAPSPQPPQGATAKEQVKPSHGCANQAPLNVPPFSNNSSCSTSESERFQDLADFIKASLMQQQFKM